MTTDVLAYSVAADSNGNSLSTTGFNLAHERSVTFQAMFKTRAGPLPFPFYFFDFPPHLSFVTSREKCTVRIRVGPVGTLVATKKREWEKRELRSRHRIRNSPAPPRGRQLPQQEADQKCLESLQAKTQTQPSWLIFSWPPSTKNVCGCKSWVWIQCLAWVAESISPDVFCSLMVSSCLKLIQLTSWNILQSYETTNRKQN